LARRIFCNHKNSFKQNRKRTINNGKEQELEKQRIISIMRREFTFTEKKRKSSNIDHVTNISNETILKYEAKLLQ